MVKPGDLIFVKGSGLVAEAIDWAENGTYSHVAVYVGDGSVLEAQGGRLVGYNLLAAYKGCYGIGYIDASDEIRRQVIDYAKTQIGKRYGWKSIIYLIFKLVFHINYKYNRDIGIICSVYANDCWKAVHRPLTKIFVPTPQDLANSPLVRIEKGVT